MTFLWAWLRVEFPRRWRSLAVLALLIAVASGTVLATVAGARRQATAIERLDQRTQPAQAAILANTPGFDWARIRALDEVEELARFGPGFPIEGLPQDVQAEPLFDPQTMRTIERPVVYSGRLTNPSRVDEAVVSRTFESRFGLGVGDLLHVVLPTPAEFQAEEGSGPGGAFTGPRLSVRIVGVVASPWYSDLPGDGGRVTLSAAVAARYPLSTLGDQRDPRNTGSVNAMLRLRGGKAAIPRLRTDLARVSGRSDIEVWNLAEEFGRPLQRQTTFEARCLLAFGAAALLASLFLVGQAIVRYAAASTVELQTLRGLGMTPRQSIAAAAAAPAIAGAFGAALAVGAALVASRWFPIGTAALREPAPGIAADWTVFGLGVVLIVLLVASGAAVAGWLSVRSTRRETPVRRSTVASAAARAGLPVPLATGARFAFEPGRGRTAVPVRPALVGAVTGVLGILAALTFSQGVSDAAAHPERFGQTFQLYGFLGVNGQDVGPVDELAAALRADPDVTGVDDARVAVATGPRGSGSVTLYTHTSGRKELPAVVNTGRMPETADEVLLAPQSLKVLHTHVGATVALAGTKGSRTVTVTGSGLVPVGPHNGYADGGWLTDAGYDALFSGHKFHLAYVALRPGARTASAGATLTAALAKANPKLSTFAFQAPDQLTEIVELRQVRALPIVLGCFLALLALGAVGHALATAVRRRSHDLAVLRALGMTQWQCRWVVVTQASVLAFAGLLFGAPLGLAVGRTVWRVVTDTTPLQYVAPTAAWALVLVGPVALVLANLLAALPGRRAARLQICQILRTE